MTLRFELGEEPGTIRGCGGDCRCRWNEIKVPIQSCNAFESLTCLGLSNLPGEVIHSHARGVLSHTG